MKREHSCLVICFILFLSACGSSSTASTSATIVSDNHAACNETSENIKNAMGEILQDSDDVNKHSISRIDICNASDGPVLPDDLNEFVLNSVEEPVTGTFSVGRKSPDGLEYFNRFWIYVFIDEDEITRDIFGENNVISLDNGVIQTYEFTLPESMDKSGMLSVLLVDTYFALSNLDGRNFIFNRTLLKVPGSEFPGEIGYLNADPSDLAFLPEDISGEHPSNIDSINEKTVTIRTESYHQQASFFPIDVSTGRRAPIQCSEKSEGLITIRPMYDEGSSVRCVFPDGHEPKNTAVFLLYDQFSVNPETGEQYEVQFLDKRLGYFSYASI